MIWTGGIMMRDYTFTNTDEEYRLLKALLLKVNFYKAYDNNWDPQRMDWWRYNYHPDKAVDFFQENVHYWKNDQNEVVAFVISEYGKEDFFMVIDPDYMQIGDELMAWVFDHWVKDKEMIETFILTHDISKVNLLERNGFKIGEKGSNIRRYALEGYDFTYSVDDRFRIVEFEACGNYDSRVEIVKNTFNNPNYNRTRLDSLMKTPAYEDALHLVVVDDNNECLGYCMGWVNEHNPEFGNIEPMGVHSDYRQVGLGKALAKECFKRLCSRGVKYAEIASDPEPDVSNYLYESLKPIGNTSAYAFSKVIK